MEVGLISGLRLPFERGYGMVRRLRIAAVAAVLLLSAHVNGAQAAPLQGGFSITGNFLPVVGATGVQTTLGLATGLDFINFFGSAATPGVDGTVFVNSGSGDFTGLVGQYGQIRDFSFAAPGSVNFPMASLLAFQSFTQGLTFDLMSVGVVLQTSTFLLLSGDGILHMKGFADTNGTFNFSANGSRNTFSFSASQGATTAVPEAASLLAVAVGLLSGAGYLRRRSSN
jgi:hypothetical protein